MKTLTRIAIALALMVIALGAYTRLTDAGLGCPDWPGCYGALVAPYTDQHLAHAEQAFPGAKIELHKAWNEMVHRYFAGALALCIGLLAALAFWRFKAQRPWVVALLGLLLFQATLGMLTVTLNLRPLVVTGHLLGGMATLALLWWLALRLGPAPARPRAPFYLRWLAVVAALVVVGQIALGGWTAANYASLACTQLPVCEGDWWSRLHPEAAFNLLSPPADNYQYGVLGYEARMTIHVAHRFGAMVTSALLILLASGLWRRGQKVMALGLAALLGVQLCLGLANVVLSVPLAVALAHNLVALLLFLLLLTLNHGLWSGYEVTEPVGRRALALAGFSGHHQTSGGDAAVTYRPGGHDPGPRQLAKSLVGYQRPDGHRPGVSRGRRHQPHPRSTYRP